MEQRLSEGALVGGRFQLQRRIGTGATGAVWLAHDNTTGTAVALKILHEHIRQLLAGREQLRHEADLLGKLDHPALARPLAFEASAEMAYMAMELADGVPLSRLLGDHAASSEHFPAAMAVSIATQLCDAVQSAHDAGIIHRDLKPQNVMVDATRQVPVVKVLDFGVARLVANDSFDATTLGRRVGSLFYMSPEQLRGDVVGPAGDVFALCTIIFELITLKRAWALDENGRSASAFDRPIPRIRENSYQAVMERILRGPRPRASENRRELSWSLDEFLFSALAIETEERVTSAADLGRRLQELQHELPFPNRSGPFDVATDSMNETITPAVGAGPVATQTNARLPLAEQGLSQHADPQPSATMTNEQLEDGDLHTVANPRTPLSAIDFGDQTVQVDRPDSHVSATQVPFVTIGSEEIEEISDSYDEDLVKKILEGTSADTSGVQETVHETPEDLITNSQRPPPRARSTEPEQQPAFPPVGPTMLVDEDDPREAGTRIIESTTEPPPFATTPSETSPETPVIDAFSPLFLGLMGLAVVGIIAALVALFAN